MFFGLFRRKPTTVNEALGALIQAQEDLQEVASDRFEEAHDQRNRAQVLVQRAEANEAEAKRAGAVVKKLLEITDPDE